MSNFFTRFWKMGLMIIVIGGIGFWGGRIWEQTRSVSLSPSVDWERQILGIGSSPPVGAVSSTVEVDFKHFWELWQLLKEKYYEQPVKDQTLYYGALSGMASSFGDPYTTFFEPKSAEEFQQALSGKFEGIGAEIGIKDDQLQIIAPLPDTPAERAGLLAGDQIIKIDAQDTAGMTVEKAVSLIRGPANTKITITIFRPAQKKPPFDVTIVRQQIRVKSVRIKFLPENIAYIEVTHFNDDTESGFRQAVQSVLRKNPKGIVLDLRNNPGGFLNTALNMTGYWIGDEIAVKERRQGKIVDTLRGTGRAWLAGIPTIVLVNQGSASAAEIVAGALKDYHQATIVGMKTFGKGSVQDYMTFADGSGIKITIAEWVTPQEQKIHKTGLEPDVLVDRTPEDYANQRDPQLDRAVGILTGTATSTSVTATSTKTAP